MDYDHWWERPGALLYGLVLLGVAAWICWDVVHGIDSPIRLILALSLAVYGGGSIVFAVKRRRRRDRA